MPKKSNYDQQHDSEYQFSKAAWEACRDTEHTACVRVSIELVPTAQRGVFYVAMHAHSTAIEEKGRRLAFVQGSYPNGRSKTMSAYLFALANSLSQMVESVRAEDARTVQASF